MSIHRDIENVVSFLDRTLRQSKCNGYVLGLSGGIDSAVVAALAKMAIDRFNSRMEILAGEHPRAELRLVHLPISSHPEDSESAQAVADYLGLDITTFDLESTFQSFANEMQPDPVQSEDGAKHYGNVKARLRMTALYFVANANNLLVLGTDNASETFTGYFTKHGDGAADVFSISDFVKREVYDLGRHLGLPEIVLTRAPSAGLWEGQTDESEMGIPYDFIDNHLEGLHGLNYATYGDKAEPYERKLLQLHYSSEHKRKAPATFKRK